MCMSIVSNLHRKKHCQIIQPKQYYGEEIMSCRGQKLTSWILGLAILILIAVLVVVWVQVDQRSSESYKYPSYTIINEEINTATDANKNHHQNKTLPDITADSKDTPVHFIHKLPEDPPNKDLEETPTAKPKPNVAGGTKYQEEFIKPIKLHVLPLPKNDLLYDQLNNNQVPDESANPIGHFRSKSTEEWDPFPQYEFTAFGRKYRLELAYNNKFVSPDLHITHIMENYTEKHSHDTRINGCFYTGNIKGESHSNVAVSLCNGMTGYIRTHDDNFFIEPIEKFKPNSKTSIMHRIRKMPHSDQESTENSREGGKGEGSGEKCGTTGNVDPHHRIVKRGILIDDLDTNRKFVRFQSSGEILNRRSIRDTWTNTYDKRHFMDDHRHNHEYFIKVMVVADKETYENHKSRKELTHYILTLMSHVSLLFKDASIGNPISLTVVRIHILENQSFQGHSSEGVLRNFCQWQKNIREPHNVALLLTKHSLCSNTSTECTTLGVAEIGSMCAPTSCAVVRDRGLSTSFVIAHEIGHTLGMMHDEDDSCQEFQYMSKSKNIMSKMIEKDMKPWHWSNCSKQKLFDFLENRKSECLLEPPIENYITEKITDRLPGEVFEIDRQCELTLGHESKWCDYYQMPQVRKCKTLFCTIPGKSCRLLEMVPWADGTSCGNDSWCHHGECINQNRALLIPQNGGWGKWQEWSACSRTCGGGIRSTKRSCDSPPPANGGTYCRGKSVRYESCNIQPCPDDRDFRELQCADWNGHKFESMPNLSPNTKWIPKYGVTGVEGQCRLFCQIAGTEYYYLLKDKVTDGTKCQLNGYDICVNGICRPGGCDNSLYSNKTLDSCGVCGGDNSKCREITGSFNETTHENYNFVIRIPKGSSNIEIKQISHKHVDTNYLALRNEKNEYYLNGNKSVSQYTKKVFIDGMPVTYSGSNMTIETITTSKNDKLPRDLIVEVLSGRNLGGRPLITYKYTVSKDNAPRYDWQLYEKPWTKCSAICQGYEYRKAVCKDLVKNETVSDVYCRHLKNNIARGQPCNQHCYLQWRAAPNNSCSVHCGIGVRNITYQCHKIDTKFQRLELITANSRSDTIVNARHCSNIPKPTQVAQPCEGPCDGSKWEYSEWSECTKSCGGGITKRSAKCVDDYGREINAKFCHKLDKTNTQNICNENECPNWSYEEWTPCSSSCGEGIRMRPYYCHAGHVKYSPQNCNEQNLDSIKEKCNAGPCPQWKTDSWSECSINNRDCVQSRSVVCVSAENKVIEDKKCGDRLKPNSTKHCKKEHCFTAPVTLPLTHIDENEISINYIPNIVNHFQWKSGEWSECSKTCNGGIQRRLVVCRNKFGEEDETQCDSLTKPQHIQECNTLSCPYWTMGGWTNCNSQCKQQRQVSCLDSTGRLVEDYFCNEQEKPSNIQNCTEKQCNKFLNNAITLSVLNRSKYPIQENKESRRDDKYRWEIGKWSKCSNSCGKGKKRRQLVCKDVQNDIRVVDQFCQRFKMRPPTEKNCEIVKCSHTWVEGPWSPCSKTCGEGQKRRNVTCHKVLTGGFKDPQPIDDSYLHTNKFCNIHEKPSTISTCNDRNCNDMFYWAKGTWSSCSQPCGRKGKQVRRIYCQNLQGKKVKRKYCNPKQRPQRSRKCNQTKCLSNCKDVQQTQKTTENRDYILFIKGKQALVYCHDMDTSNPKEFITLKKENFAEFYHKRLRNPMQCPYDGRRNESCDCVDLPPEYPSGRALFYKVRLNITSLQIIDDDFTFASGSAINYGTAGDCYSRLKGCPQGQFVIDLRDTSFRLSNNVRWINKGTSANSKMNTQSQRVQGVCGGLCGRCMPETRLHLDITENPTIPKY